MNNDWKNDWPLFTKLIAERVNARKTDAQLSAEFGDTPVIWEGIVGDLSLLDDDLIPGLSMVMPSLNYKLKNGKPLNTDHLALDVDDKTRESWRACQTGQRVRFSTKIMKGLGSSGSVRVSMYEDSASLMVRMGLAELIK